MQGGGKSLVAGENGSGGGMEAPAAPCLVREQDRFMPIANVIRIMRKVLPAHAKISDDAKETIQECVSEYISFITSEANDRCQREQRKTITAEDVLWAMSKLGFDDYVEPLTLYLHRYREMEGDHRGSIRGEPLPPSLRRTASGPPPRPHPPPLLQFHHLPPLQYPIATAAAMYGDAYYLSLYGSAAAADGGGQGSATQVSANGVLQSYDLYAKFK